jgi:hypothetical protein
VFCVSVCVSRLCTALVVSPMQLLEYILVRQQDISYPCKRNSYARITGKGRPINIANIRKTDLGLTACLNPVQANDVDIFMFNNDR